MNTRPAHHKSLADYAIAQIDSRMGDFGPIQSADEPSKKCLAAIEQNITGEKIASPHDSSFDSVESVGGILGYSYRCVYHSATSLRYRKNILPTRVASEPLAFIFPVRSSKSGSTGNLRHSSVASGHDRVLLKSPFRVLNFQHSLFPHNGVLALAPKGSFSRAGTLCAVGIGGRKKP